METNPAYTAQAPPTFTVSPAVPAQDDPLLDCLVYLARFHGRTASRTALVAGLPLVQNRLTVELFTRAAERADLAARVVKRPLKKIHNLLLPAVLPFAAALLGACLVAEAAEEPEQVPEHDMVYVPAGEFLMGTSEEEARRLAEQYGLLVTGGSDSHGPAGSYPVEIGEVDVPDECAEALIAWARKHSAPMPA